jgi:alpha-galactosidase
MLDPRFPDVRSYHADTYERAMREWNFDGLKIDFGDAISSQKEDSGEAEGGRDIASLPEATAKLFDEVYNRAVAVRPDAMIEYKMGYHGPRMRAACNFIRSSDCKNDSLTDRVHIVDLRLTSGNTPIHADTIDWHAAEPVEAAALHLLHVLFSVPQLSMRLGTLPPEHHEMLRFWLGWWTQHRRTLLGGELFGLDPATNYPVVQARGEDGYVGAVYADAVVRLGETSGPLHIVNGTLHEGVVLDCATALGTRRVHVYDCRGNLIVDEERVLSAGLLRLEIPPAGLATLAEVNSARS